MRYVSAKNWRPQLFSDFVGQEYIIHSLKQSVLLQQLAHGYLFIGSRGVGKTSCARVFAKALNCTALSPEGEPCLVCRACVEIKEGHHLDTIEIDGASNRGIDRIREIKENVNFLPAYSKFKVYIIDEVHMLTTESFNAILKVLEEPPNHVLFIFATTEPSKVESTIRSRCQQFFFRRMKENEIVDRLKLILESMNIEYEIEALQLIAKSSDGAMRDSQSLLDQAIIYSGRKKIHLKEIRVLLGKIPEEEVLGLLSSIRDLNAQSIYETISRFYHEGEDLQYLIIEIVDYLRYILFLHYNLRDLLSSLSSEQIEILNSLKEAFSIFVVQKMIEDFISLHQNLKKEKHPLFVILEVFLRMCSYRDWISPQSLVKQLVRLEQSVLTQSSTDVLLSKKEPLSFQKTDSSHHLTKDIDSIWNKIREKWKLSNYSVLLNGIVKKRIEDNALILSFGEESHLNEFQSSNFKQEMLDYLHSEGLSSLNQISSELLKVNKMNTIEGQLKEEEGRYL